MPCQVLVGVRKPAFNDTRHIHVSIHACRAVVLSVDEARWSSPGNAVNKRCSARLADDWKRDSTYSTICDIVLTVSLFRTYTSDREMFTGARETRQAPKHAAEVGLKIDVCIKEQLEDPHLSGHIRQNTCMYRDR